MPRTHSQGYEEKKERKRRRKKKEKKEREREEERDREEEKGKEGEDSGASRALWPLPLLCPLPSLFFLFRLAGAPLERRPDEGRKKREGRGLLCNTCPPPRPGSSLVAANDLAENLP